MAILQTIDGHGIRRDGACSSCLHRRAPDRRRRGHAPFERHRACQCIAPAPWRAGSSCSPTGPSAGGTRPATQAAAAIRRRASRSLVSVPSSWLRATLAGESLWLRPINARTAEPNSKARFALPCPRAIARRCRPRNSVFIHRAPDILRRRHKLTSSSQHRCHTVQG